MAEHMFNMLNSLLRMGKNPPMVCKILGCVSPFPRDGVHRFREACYLLEEMGFRNRCFQPVGLGIAFLECRLAFIRIRNGKA
jgi:hypothetical protein